MAWAVSDKEPPGASKSRMEVWQFDESVAEHFRDDTGGQTLAELEGLRQLRGRGEMVSRCFRVQTTDRTFETNTVA